MSLLLKKVSVPKKVKASQDNPDFLELLHDCDQLSRKGTKDEHQELLLQGKPVIDEKRSPPDNKACSIFKDFLAGIKHRHFFEALSCKERYHNVICLMYIPVAQIAQFSCNTTNQDLLQEVQEIEEEAIGLLMI